jgi:N-carbamoyl-L-amino-acid hydrolase
MTHPHIDAELLLADLEELARIGADPAGGISRLAFGADDMAGRAWVAAQARAIGLEVRTDSAGNTIALLPGSDPGLAPIAIGSHTDTVAHGGRFDGALGVLAGLACARAMRSAGARLRHPLEVINFVAEEATVLGTLGSNAMVGGVSAAQLEQGAYDGRPITEHLRAAGIDPARVCADRRAPGSMAAYLELHIEQGDRLEAESLAIGVVEGIVGIRRYEALFVGQANHAGTTQMARRRDALVAAAAFVLAVRDIAVAHAIVGTVGALALHPNVSNVIPGRVELACEIRSLDDGLLDTAEQALHERAGQLGGTLTLLSRKAPVRCDPGIQAAIARAAQQCGRTYRSLPSGAGHDAMCIADIAPVGMLFVPSRGGTSHAPDEWTGPEQCADGARVLMAALLELDGALDS